MNLLPRHEPEPDQAQRQCRRCRLWFDDDPTLESKRPSVFWLCTACRAVLLPGRA